MYVHHITLFSFTVDRPGVHFRRARRDFGVLLLLEFRGRGVIIVGAKSGCHALRRGIREFGAWQPLDRGIYLREAWTGVTCCEKISRAALT